VSQQQLVPEPQDGSSSDSQGNEEIYKRPYKSARSGNMPKDEHPSTFEETIPPHSYRAQDRVTHNTPDPRSGAHFHETNAHERQSRRRRFSPDGDALENGYQPYRQQQRVYTQVPPWARPQQHKNRHVLRWIVMLILAIILIKPLLILIGGLFLAGLTLLGFIILIPLIVLGALLLAGLVLAILGIVLGRAVWRGIWRW
jgi:hypothetical protein